MERAGVGVTQLAKAVDTPKQNVSRHMKGERRLTDVWAKRYAPVLRTSPERLIFPDPKSSGAAAPTRFSRRTKLVEVPLLSWVSAGRLAAQETVTAANVRKTLLATGLPPGDWIALEVEGDSMNLVAPDGSIIFVDRSDDKMIVGRFYVFASEHGEATFKRYRSGPFRLQPYSTNPDHETIYPTTEMRVIGRVRRVLTDL